jgi:hypothetical protein
VRKWISYPIEFIDDMHMMRVWVYSYVDCKN